MLYSILIGLDVVIAGVLVALVLMQQGKGASAGAAFGGGGASGTVFGSRGSSTFLTKATAALATSFFVITLVLAYLASNQAGQPSSVTDSIVDGSIPEVVGSSVDESIPPAVSDSIEELEQTVDTQAQALEESVESVDGESVDAVVDDIDEVVPAPKVEESQKAAPADIPQ